MKKGNPIVHLTLVLAVISLVTAGLLGIVNAVTADRIAEQKRVATELAYSAVLPSDTGYEAVEFDRAKYPDIVAVSEVKGKGYVVELKFSGAQSIIQAVFGVGADHKLLGTSVIQHGETASLGSHIVDEWFREQFVGEDEGIALKKSGGKIDAITSATISSQAMVNAAGRAIAVVKALG